MISSASNDNFKRWKSLLDRKGLKKHGQFLLFGEKVVAEAKKNHADLVLESLSQETLSKELFDELDIFGTKSEILVCRQPELPSWDESHKGKTLLLPLGDPSNLGALIRTACAFEIDQIVLLEEAAHPFLPRSVRSASGSLLSAPLLRGPSIKDLKAENIYALDLSGEAIHKISWPEDVTLLVGEEGPGLPDLNFKRVTIPQNSKVESLNAMAAATIALYKLVESS